MNFPWCRAAASSYKKQFEEATRGLEKLKAESERMKEQSESAVAESRQRLRAAELLIEQLNQHKAMSPAYRGSSPIPGVNIHDVLTPETAEKVRKNRNIHLAPAESDGVLDTEVGNNQRYKNRSPGRSLSVARTLSP